MEVVIEHHTLEADLCEWPKVPQSNFESTEISEERLEKLNNHARTLRILTSKASAGQTETQVPNQTSTAPSQSLEIKEIAEERVEALEQHEPKSPTYIGRQAIERVHPDGAESIRYGVGPDLRSRSTINYPTK